MLNPTQKIDTPRISRSARQSLAERRRNRQRRSNGSAVAAEVVASSSPPTTAAPATERSRTSASTNTKNRLSVPSQITTVDANAAARSLRSKVRFEAPHAITDSITIPGRSSYTQDEKKAMWVSNDEHQCTIQQCKETVRSMMASQSDDPSAHGPLHPRGPTRAFSFTRGSGSAFARSAAGGGDSTDNSTDNNTDSSEINTRGLEYMTAKGFDIISAKSKRTVHAVLQEQKRLRELHGQSLAMSNDSSTHSTSSDDSTGGIFDKRQSTSDMIADVLAQIVMRVSKHRHRIAQLAGMKDAQAAYGTQCHRARLTTNAAAVSMHNPKNAPMRRSRSGGSLSHMVREFNDQYAGIQNEIREPQSCNTVSVTNVTNANNHSSSNNRNNNSETGSGKVNWWKTSKPNTQTNGTGTTVHTTNNRRVGTEQVDAYVRPEPQRRLLRPSNSFGSLNTSNRRREREPRRRRGLRRVAPAVQPPIKPAVNDDWRRSSASTAASTVSAASEATLSIS